MIGLLLGYLWVHKIRPAGILCECPGQIRWREQNGAVGSKGRPCRRDNAAGAFARSQRGRPLPPRAAVHVAGDEYLHDMQQARVTHDGTAHWVEVCFCRTPLEEERPYWEKYFDFVSVKDAHARRNCRDVNGSEPWACCDCDCTRRLEEKLETCGQSFLTTLRGANQQA